MESLIQQVFERSFEGKEKQEPSKAATPAPVPLDSGHSTKSLQEQFGVDVGKQESWSWEQEEPETMQ